MENEFAHKKVPQRHKNMIVYQLCVKGSNAMMDGPFQCSSKKIFKDKDIAEKYISEFLIVCANTDINPLYSLDMKCSYKVKVMELELVLE